MHGCLLERQFNYELFPPRGKASSEEVVIVKIFTDPIFLYQKEQFSKVLRLTKQSVSVCTADWASLGKSSHKLHFQLVLQKEKVSNGKFFLYYQINLDLMRKEFYFEQIMGI